MSTISLRALFMVFSIAWLLNSGAVSQTATSPDETGTAANLQAGEESKASDLDQIKKQLEAHRSELDELRRLVAAQSEIIEKLQKSTATAASDPGNSLPIEKIPATDDVIEKRLGDLEKLSKQTAGTIEKNQLGSLGFSGDLRMQYDSIYGQLNSAPNINDSLLVGNELSSRQRIRFRLRLLVTGKIGREVFTGSFTSAGERKTDKEFDWGFRLSTGSLSNPVSPNPVLTDFYSRKPFALDRAYVAWRPRQIAGLRLIAGKFEPNWLRTEMTIDNDLQVEGVAQSFSREFKNSPIKQFSINAWQLPMLERNSSFVRNTDGSINIDESKRAGKDLGMFGAQLSAKLGVGRDSTLTLSLANLHFTNTDAISPVQVFGNQLQLPVTIIIPATATEPSRTVTGVATIPRELLNSGNGNLGLASGTNAAVNRDGRLSSRFNLVDIIAQLELKQFRHAPVTFMLDYVRNTGVRNVISSGTAGNDVILRNNQNTGLWAEFRIQSLRKNRGTDFNASVPGDVLLSYTFLRIEKDAVFTPLNWDDLVQQSDIQAHRVFLSYTVDPRVTFNITGLYNQRLNGLLGPFRTTPAGSLDRNTIRLQFDTVFRF